MNKELREILKQRPDLKEAIHAVNRQKLAEERETRERPTKRAKRKSSNAARRKNRPAKKRNR